MNYMQSIKKANTLDELRQIKDNFLSECIKRENKIKVSNILSNIDNIVKANEIFESLTGELMYKKEGKNLINKYAKLIKENNSLKTVYTYYKGLSCYKDSDSKKAYITEALSLDKVFNYNEYIKGIGNIVNVISESFNLLGDEYVVNNVKCVYDENHVGDSLFYLASTKKNIKNLNEFINHIDNVSNIISENIDTINSDLTLTEIVNDLTDNASFNEIFETENKEDVFKKTKQICLEMISNQKQKNNDNEIINKLNEMEEKLSNKNYTFETFTKDIIYMNELQEVLK